MEDRDKQPDGRNGGSFRPAEQPPGWDGAQRGGDGEENRVGFLIAARSL